jgi:peptide/nickel transport system permease protein
MSLSLINFGIDEFVSPRLRSAGKTKLKTTRGRTVRMRIGFTPVLGGAPLPSKEPALAGEAK